LPGLLLLLLILQGILSRMVRRARPNGRNGDTLRVEASAPLI
jgi:hypothetical protein